MKKPLKLLILSTLIYANTYDTKAENTLHSTDRCATAKYWEKNKNHERVKLLAVVAALSILYFCWNTQTLKYIGLKSSPQVPQAIKRVQRMNSCRQNNALESVIRDSILINNSNLCKILPWNKTIPGFPDEKFQYKVALDNGEHICKNVTQEELEIYQKLSNTGIVPKIIKKCKFHPSEGEEYYICIMEYPLKKYSPLGKIRACIRGLKEIMQNTRCLNIEPYDMVEHCFFINLDRKNEIQYRFHTYNKDTSNENEKREKVQVMSLARSLYADVYKKEIHEHLDSYFEGTFDPHDCPRPHFEILFEKCFESADDYHNKDRQVFLPIMKRAGKPFSEYFRKTMGKNDSSNNDRVALFPILTRAGKGEIETLEDFFRQISLQVGVGEDTAEKILSHWRRKVDKKKINEINEINDTIIDYCCQRNEI